MQFFEEKHRYLINLIAEIMGIPPEELTPSMELGGIWGRPLYL